MTYIIKRDLHNKTPQVWLGKFWIGKWEISLYDGSHLDWKNFAERPQPSNSPIFAAIRMDGFWNSVDGRTKYVQFKFIFTVVRLQFTIAGV